MRCKYVVIGGIALILLVNFVIFPRFSGIYGGSGNLPLDVMFHFTVDDVRRALSIMGERGRRAFVVGHLLVDTPYAVVYAFTYVCVFSLLGAGLKFRILPFVVATFDILENVVLSVSALTFPNLRPWASIASIAGTLKWMGVLLLIVVFFYLLGRRILKGY